MFKDRNQIISYLKKFREEKTSKYHIERIGVFGSVAKKTATENSDLDIVVKLSKQDLFDIIGIKQDLEEDLNVSVDVVSYRKQMNAFLKRRIDEDAIYV